jgi:hypothetical protein
LFFSSLGFHLSFSRVNQACPGGADVQLKMENAESEFGRGAGDAKLAGVHVLLNALIFVFGPF